MRSARPIQTVAPIPWNVWLTRSFNWIAWRYRYLAGFVLWGFLSIGLEVALVTHVLPANWPAPLRTSLGFVVGMLFAFFTNARFNFRIPREQFLRAFFLFALVSMFSYGLNLWAACWLSLVAWNNYPVSRFVTSGCLFMIAYYFHRRFTFRPATRRIGLAVYAVEGEDVERAFASVGDQCDLLHVDLVDNTVNPEAAPVDLQKIDEARRYWKWQPMSIHLMTRRPATWIECCKDVADCFLLHIDIDDNLAQVIARCRQLGCQVGVVWHYTVTFAQIMPYLPHVDFVMVLGIREPGRSGQPVMEEALDAARMFADLAPRYGYELMFDGGVTAANVGRIPASILVSSSGVLRAQSPVRAVLQLMAGV
jgi:pentose-5-phosphate-3-epimerase/putative flippase GtrA